MKRTLAIQTMRLGMVSGLGVLVFWTAAIRPTQAQRADVAVPVATNAPARGGDRAEYSPVVRDLTATNLYWGDTHLHTRNSADSYLVGNETLSPEDAFRYALGQTVAAHNGMHVRLRRPLDFLAVTDHAEYLGVFARLKREDPSLMGWPLGRRWSAMLVKGDRGIGREWVKAIQSNDAETQVPEDVRRSIWKEIAVLADRYNMPGRFTAFTGYEWTSMINGDNLHRVVLFRDGSDRTLRTMPFSAQESTDPEALWRVLEAYEAQTGGEVLAIPHNGNLSNGRMFALETVAGRPFTAEYATRRARWEPLYEVTQVKGDGETHPALSPSDEFADFERWDESNASGDTPKQPWMLRHEYARQALKDGLQLAASTGVNPFRFGMIGSTDGHNGYTAVTEDDFWGKFVDTEPSAGRATERFLRRLQENWRLNASGLAAVWAPENTRDAIFAAFKRREVYGTTGSRIKLRFFGGWEYADEDVRRPDYARIGYAKGVPMGGELLAAPKGRAPRFMVVAARDPDEANLDRVQVIKGWLDAQGETHEKIYDVALSDGRKVDPVTGKAPPVGSTVDVGKAGYTNSIGDPELATVWTDPDFDPAQRAFYYVRVLEIPKPRWTAYDAQFFNLELPAKIPMTTQDRAYSSPIWYQPAAPCKCAAGSKASP